MSPFSSLLKYRKGKPPADAQAKAHEEFAGKVSQSRLKLRSPDKAIPDTGRHFIIGVATYSIPELELLDNLEDSLGTAVREVSDVQVFDVLDCKTMTDFGRFIPGVSSVFRTPVIGVIIDGRLVDQATGLPDVETALHRFHVLNHSHPT
jgi:hypothetical protein